MSTSWESPVLGAVTLEARPLAEGIAAGLSLSSAGAAAAPDPSREWTEERIHAG